MLSYVQYSGNGITKAFAVPFKYLSKSHVGVTVNGTAVPFSWLSDTLVQATTAPGAGSVVEVRRTTPRDTILVDFSDGSTLTETDLDTAALQTFYLSQESFDAAGGTLSINSDGSYSALNRRISAIADPLYDQDAATKGWVNSATAATKAATEAARDAALAAQTDATSSKAMATAKATEAATSAAAAAASAAAAAESVNEGIAPPSALHLGGVYSEASETDKFVTGIGTDGHVTKAQVFRPKVLGVNADFTATVGRSGTMFTLYGTSTFNLTLPAPATALGCTFEVYNTTNYSRWLVTPASAIWGMRGAGNTGLYIPPFAIYRVISDGNVWLVSAISIPDAGLVSYYAASSPPAGYLKANGAAISRATYKDLFNAIGVTFGSGDGSTTFNVPDLRGLFIRSWDDGRVIDSGRTFGSYQDMDYQSHTHGVNDPGHAHWNGLGGTSPTQSGFVFNSVTSAGATSASGTGIWLSASGGNETRPRNLALLACIKY